MPATTLTEANQLVLQTLGDVVDPIVLGFLPFSVDDEEAILTQVRIALEPAPASVDGLLRIAPAATAYALAVAPARTLTTGGHFWSALETDLGLVVPSNSRPFLADAFRRVAARLGLLDGTIEAAGWTHVAPFIFQAGIIHHWKDSLAHGLRSTLRRTPAPDLEDPQALASFARQLKECIHNQPTLKRILETEVGPLLVQRLVAAYQNQDWSVLPPHLREPIRDAFSEVGRGLVLPSPFLAFNAAFREMQVTLPAVPPRLASADTYWKTQGHCYAARKETAIPWGELENGDTTIELVNLQGFDDQSFALKTGFDAPTPFRVFRADSGREHKFRLIPEAMVPPGAYIVAMAADVRTDDEEYVEQRNGFRMLELELRPGDDPLSLRRGDQTWSIEAMLQKGIYVDHDRANTALLQDGGFLHYGEHLGLVAYFPAKEVDDEPFVLAVECPEQNLQEEAVIEVPQTASTTYVFQADLEAGVSKLLALLPPGIHSLKITLGHSTAKVERELWYWKGLDRISQVLGFDCSELPRNLNLPGCRGLGVGENRVTFLERYHAPTVTIALTSPRAILHIPRAGVRVSLMEPGHEWEDEPDARRPVVATPNDRRVLRFQSGGFQRWTIIGRGRTLTELNSKRTSYVTSLAGINIELGGGRIRAKNEEGVEIPLITITRPLTASPPSCHLGHADRTEVWKFKVSVPDGGELAASITDLSDAPDRPQGELVPIAEQTESGLCFAENRFGAGTIVVNAYLDEEPSDSATTDEGSIVRLKVTNSIDALEDGLWAIDFFYRRHSTADWLPLESVEQHGYSNLRIFAWGDRPPAAGAGWWPRLRRAERTRGQAPADPELAAALQGMSLQELDRALIACRYLLTWKYSGAVWRANAHRLEVMPMHLAQHRFAPTDGSAAVWWRQASIDVADYAAAEATPVVGQFLLATQLDCLRIPRAFLVPAAKDGLRDPVARSMNLPAEIHAAGSLKEWLIGAHSEGRLNQSMIPCYAHFLEVHIGQAQKFGDFSLPAFLGGGRAGITGLDEQTIELYESLPRFEVTALLGAEHLLFSIRRLNRRCRVIDQAAQNDEAQALSGVAQAIERMSQQLDTVAPAVAQKLGWEAVESAWWTPPLLENRWAEKLAGLAWVVAAISRLAANGKLSAGDFHQCLFRLLSSDDPTEPTAQYRLRILLSHAPELFSFYLALFELTLPSDTPS